jgi:ATP-dependent RNA helicase DDX24/MAK5
VDISVQNIIKERLTLARQLDQLEHSNKKIRNDEDWFKKAALEADIAFSEVDDEEDRQSKTSNHSQKVKTMKNQLHNLLQKPLIPKGVSSRFITSNFNPKFAQIAMTAKGSLFPTLNKPVALDVLKGEPQGTIEN